MERFAIEVIATFAGVTAGIGTAKLVMLAFRRAGPCDLQKSRTTAQGRQATAITREMDDSTKNMIPILKISALRNNEERQRSLAERERQECQEEILQQKRREVETRLNDGIGVDDAHTTKCRYGIDGCDDLCHTWTIVGRGVSIQPVPARHITFAKELPPDLPIRGEAERS